MNPAEDAKSSPETIAECEAAITLFEKQRLDLQLDLRELRDKEDLASGKFFAAEIHALQKENLVLQTEILILRNKIKRIRYTQRG
jgi:hypothetical protein